MIEVFHHQGARMGPFYRFSNLFTLSKGCKGVISGWVYITYRYGWGLINKEVGYYPVYNVDPVAPPELLNLTFCKWVQMCENNKCSCYKNEVKCLPSICDRCTLYRRTNLW